MTANARQRGTILIVTMFIVLAIAAMAIVYARTARVEAIRSANVAAQAQADAIARGAVQYAMGVISESMEVLITSDDIDAEAVELGGGYFWFIKPDPRATEGLTFGLIDESSKLNLNIATRDMLIKLPRMTDVLASSIIDWRDEDDNPMPDGAESDYYLSLRPAYYAKNGPFETVDELMLVRGATVELVYGEDINRNNALDPNENDGDESLPYDNRDGSLDRGLIEYVTVYTYQPEEDFEEGLRVNVNQSDTTRLRELIEERAGVSNVNAIVQDVRDNRPYRNLVDLLYRSNMPEDVFDAIWDRLTVADEMRHIGLININTAPEAVLATLPGLSDADAATLAAARESANPASGGFSWVRGVLSEEKAISMGDFVTGRTYQYTVDVVALSEHGRSFKRIRAVIDAAVDPPRIVHWADLTPLGWPLDETILETVRAGQPLPAPRRARDF